MRIAYLTAALIPFTLASPFALEARADNAAKVLAGLKTIDADSKKLNATLNKFGPTTAPTTKQALAVNSASNKVSKDIKATTKTCTASSAFTSAESSAGLAYVQNSIEPDTISLLQNFINHEPGFNKAGFDSTVESGLKSQQKLVATLSKCLISKASSGDKAAASSAAAAINAKFNQAIAAYAS